MAVPPSIRSDAKATYNAAHKAVTKDLYTSRLRKDNKAWKQWDTFCTWLHIPKDLQDIKDKIPFQQIFAHKVRTGALAANNKPFHKQSLEQYIRSVGQIFAAVGGPDPRISSMGAINFRLGQQLATYVKEYPSPGRLRPLPVSILHCMDSATKSVSPRDHAITDLVWIAFFFLL